MLRVLSVLRDSLARLGRADWRDLRATLAPGDRLVSRVTWVPTASPDSRVRLDRLGALERVESRDRREPVDHLVQLGRTELLAIQVYCHSLYLID